MQETTYENNLDALNAGVAQLRKEIAALAAHLKQPAGCRIDMTSIEGQHLQEVLADGSKPNGGWTSFRSRLSEVGARGEKVAEGVAHEIERHPLIGGMVAFGLGFLIARLLFKRSNIKGNPASF